MHIQSSSGSLARPSLLEKSLQCFLGISWRSELSKDRKVASKLYEKLTSYEAFLFIHLYRDLTGTIAKTTKLLQSKDIRIRNVERWIMTLYERLKGNYPEASNLPTPLLRDSTFDEIINELFDENGILLSSIYF